MDDKKNACWQSSKAEKFLLALLIILSVVFLGLLIGLIMKSRLEPDNTHCDTCNSKECIGAASAFLKNMDMDTDPCTDFYQYACGGYGKRTDLIELFSNKFGERDKEINILMQQIIEQPWMDSEPNYYKKIKDFYSSCMNTTIIDKLGATPLLAKLNKVGGWPVLLGSDWKEDEFDIEKILVQFRNLGFSTHQFFWLYVSVNLRNSTRQILKLAEPSTTFPSAEYYKQEKYRNGYLKHMIDVAVLLGAEKTKAESEIKDILELETAIAELRVPAHERRNMAKFETEVAVSELQNLMPQINWIVFLNRMKLPKLITEHEKIIISHTLEDVSSLISKTSKRPLVLSELWPITCCEDTVNNLASSFKTLSNYMLWIAILESYNFLDDAFLNLYKKFSRDYEGTAEDKSDRKDYCNRLTLNCFRQGCSAMFVKQLFGSDATKSLVSEMVKNIKVELKNGISNAEWLDAKTMKKAKEKLAATTDFLAYPNELLNDSTMNDFYKSSNISEKDFFSNGLQVSKFLSDYNFASLIKKNEGLSWTEFASGVLTAGAGYYPPGNGLLIYAGILGGVFFNPNWPRYLNYGGIGTIIGHEFVHGFDDRGKQFDLHGNLNNWWANETDIKFRERADEVVNLYSSFIVPELNISLSGQKVQGEAISDIEGFQLSYKAYEKWVEQNKEETGLPGIPLNSRQLFWLQTANLWCANLPKESLFSRLQVSNHPSDRFRVLGAFMNSKYFSRDYNCPVGSLMNPEHKISFW